MKYRWNNTDLCGMGEIAEASYVQAFFLICYYILLSLCSDTLNQGVVEEWRPHFDA